MLTNRQEATYRFILDYHVRRGRAPKLTEIADGIGIRSKGVVHRYLKALSDAGLIELERGQHRGIKLTGHPTEGLPTPFTLPLVGKIAAGQPIEAIPDLTTVDLTTFFMGPNRFVLKVQGESMINAGILDGDMVIVEQRQHAMNGDIVVALIDNDEATLKFFQKNRDGTITLLPANNTLRPMIFSAERIQIQGVVIGQMRTYNKSK